MRRGICKKGLKFAHRAYVYPLLLLVFVPHFQKLGIWFAQSFSLVVGLLVCYLFLVVIGRKFPLPTDKLLLLKKQIIHRAPMIDISVSNTDEKVVGASEYIQDFLLKSCVNPKTSYVTALCSEEIAVDMAAHFKAHPVKSRMDNAILDIKVFDLTCS